MSFARTIAVIHVIATAMLLQVAPLEAEGFTWLQYTATGLEARTITDAANCPTVDVDGTAHAMATRNDPNQSFPVTACSLAVPPAAHSVSIASVTLPMPKTPPRRIAVIGDTGCRLKGGYVQACNDPKQWPFARIAETVAALRPDLIIHVGDYHYRETRCPEGDDGCAGSPYGDNWNVWQADFFKPATPLLGTAPWVMVRGNHEICGRGGQGWSRFLDPVAFDRLRRCNGPDPLYQVDIGRATLAVVDTALAVEPKVDRLQAAFYRRQYAAIGHDRNVPVWILQHRPIWSPGASLFGLVFGANKTLAQAATGSISPTVQMILSGHHHVFQTLSYGSELPVQIVAGHGGDALNPGSSFDAAGTVVEGVTVKSGLHRTAQFGFVMLEQTDSGWTVTNHDVSGRRLDHCAIVGRTAACVPASAE